MEEICGGGRLLLSLDVRKEAASYRDGQKEAAQKGLKRELTLVSATALVVGEVIAVGIFLTPAQNGW